jgi:hypothetical protein
MLCSRHADHFGVLRNHHPDVLQRARARHFHAEHQGQQGKFDFSGEMMIGNDFASMKGGVRGKYFKRFREGTNIVLVEPEVAEAFPTENAVNEALRGVLNTTRAVRRTGGLPNKALQPTSRSARPRKAKRAKRARG